MDLDFDTYNCPKIKLSSSHSYILRFIDQNSDIIYVNTHGNVIEKFSKEVHQLQLIDCISASTATNLTVLTVATKSLTMSFKKEFEISCPTPGWENKPEVFDSNLSNFCVSLCLL